VITFVYVSSVVAVPSAQMIISIHATIVIYHVQALWAVWGGDEG